MDFKLGSFWILILTIFVSSVICTSEDSNVKDVSISQEVINSNKSSISSLEEENGNTNETQNVDVQITDVENDNDHVIQEPDVPDASNYKEADDMEYGGIFQNRTLLTDVEPINEPTGEPEKQLNEEEIKLSDPIQSNLKSAVEWIESPDENTVDIDDIHSKPVNIAETWPWIVTMTALGTMFVLFLIGSVLSYKLLAKRYNNRQILINEEDMIDPNDMKHFSL